MYFVEQRKLKKKTSLPAEDLPLRRNFDHLQQGKETKNAGDLCRGSWDGEQMGHQEVSKVGRPSSGWSVLPSGKHTKNYGKSPFFMGKSTINGHFQ